MTRTLSAIVLVAVLVGAMLAPGSWAVVTLAMVASAAAAYEVAGLAAKSGTPVSGMLAAVAAAVVCGTTAWPVPQGSVLPLTTGELAIATLLVLSAIVALASGAPSPNGLARVAIALFAPIFTGLPLGLLGRVVDAGARSLVVWFVVVIAVSDTAQFLVGSQFGRRKLAPLVSPGKTIEGAIGGLVGAALAGMFVPTLLRPTASPAIDALLAVLLAVAGMLGDLFESWIKRGAGAKDSSALIPGHGGVLDRIDSYLVAAPCYYAAIACMGHVRGVL